MSTTKKIVTGLGLIALAAGGIAVGVSNLGGKSHVSKPDESIEEEVITETQVANRAVRCSNGRLVRIVGVSHDQENPGTVGDSDLGRIVIVEDVSANVLCHVLIDAQPIPRSEIFEDGSEYVGNVPNIPEMTTAFGKASWPVIIPNSCNGVGSCIWSALFKGNDCIQVGSLDYYIGSTMHEFLQLPMGTQKRFLRTRGICESDEGVDHSCMVAIGDPRAIADSPVITPHQFAGRIDLNFVRGIGGSAEARHEWGQSHIPEHVEIP